MKRIRRLGTLCLLLMVSMFASAIDFAVNLTDATIFDTSVNQFGVIVAADGTYTATAFNDEAATFTVSAARYNDKDHGWVNCVFTVPVNGPVKVGLGNCQYGGQTGTIVDGAGNSTDLTVGNANCWHNDKVNNISYTLYKGTEPTTLTITYNGYCPFISVEAVDPSELSNDATVTFAAGEATGAAYVPEAVKKEVGTTITLPVNFTMYVEGKTMTGWTDGNNTFAPGASYTVPEADVTLTAVFTTNEVSLADRTEAVTLKWNFRRDQGAPAVGWEGKSGLVWVTQATIDGKTIDVALPFSTSSGKFNNANWTDWCQVNGGTIFNVPSCKGATISMEAYGTITTTTIDGQSDYTQGQTISYTIASDAESVDVVIGDGSYYRYIQVVLPVVQSQSYENVVATADWPMDEPANYSKSNVSPEDVFSTVAVDLGLVKLMNQNGDVNTTGTSNVSSGVTFSHMRPTNGVDDYVTWILKPVAGLSFTPKKISAYIVRFGTDVQSGVTFSAKIGEGNAITLGTYTAPRNNKSKSEDKYGSSADYAENGFVEIELTEEQQAALTSGDTFSLMGTVGVGNTKAGGIAKVTIEGVVNGEAINVNMYSLATAASPAEGGSVTVYPVSEEYEEGSTIRLTATENFGYDFVSWTDGEGIVVSTEPVYTFDIAKNETLTANFEAVDTYELALTVDGTNDYMVEVSPAPTVVNGKNMYEAGQTVELTANQYEGLVTFTNWSDGDTNSNKVISMTGDIELTAMYSQADIIAGWDFYTRGNSGRKADFAAQDNDGDALNLVNTETGQTSSWLDKSTEAAGGYESFNGAAVNWCTGSANGDVGHYHWQTKINAEAFSDINVQFQMLYNYNAYQTYDVEYSLDGTTWTNFGSVTMEGAKKVASFKGELPAECNNKAELYIRMIADKTSDVDGTASANDGNTLAMFFITGTAKLVDDGIAPVLVSTVPADGATGVSASGKIVLTFDERVKLADGAVAYVNNINIKSITQNPTKGTVSGKTITFEYKGLEYSTIHNFILAANSVSDLTDNYMDEAIELSFTTMDRPTVTKKLYDFIVPDDGSFKEALTAAAARQDKNVRYRIFVKNGDYVIPANANTMVTGSDGNQYADPKTSFGTPNVSIIGESSKETTITNEMPNSLANNPDAGANEQANPLEGIRTSGVLYLTSGATDTYFQDIKLWSATADNTGRNVVLVDGGNRTICKNVTLWAYQDTYVSDNTRSLYYFEGGLLRGRTDFLCGSGDVFYNEVMLQMCQDGGYIAVPRDNVKYGYVFKDCTITGETSAVDGNYYLGRPWTEAAEAYFIDTKMEVVPRAIGWAEMSNGGCTRMAEYNSMTASGSVVDLSGRATSLGKTDPHPNNPILTAEEALEIGNLHNMFGDWDPTLATEQAPIPTNVVLDKSTSTLTWDDSKYALLWAIVKDGNVVDFTIEPSYTVTDLTADYSVRAANEMGGLSEASALATVSDGINTVIESYDVKSDANAPVYNMAGQRVSSTYKGIVVKNGSKYVNK